jgi:NTP pyrophosphatase (non-canonical NTP hydrolase)
MGILQTILDNQDRLDNRVVNDFQLRDRNGNKNLTFNFDPIRYQTILQLYVNIKVLMVSMKKTNFKWWKNLDPITKEEMTQLLSAEAIGIYNPDLRLSNVAMKVIAIIDEALEIEDAVNQEESQERLEDEFADLLHFVASLGLEIGISTEQQIEALYNKKNKVNHDRVDAENTNKKM